VTNTETVTRRHLTSANDAPEGHPNWGHSESRTGPIQRAPSAQSFVEAVGCGTGSLVAAWALTTPMPTKVAAMASTLVNRLMDMRIIVGLSRFQSVEASAPRLYGRIARSLCELREAR